MDPVPANGNLAGGSRHRQIAAGSLKAQLDSSVELGREKSKHRKTRSLSAMNHQWKAGREARLSLLHLAIRVLFQVKLLPRP